MDDESQMIDATLETLDAIASRILEGESLPLENEVYDSAKHCIAKFDSPSTLLGFYRMAVTYQPILEGILTAQP